MEFILAFVKSVAIVLGIILLFIFILILIPLILVLADKIDTFLSWFSGKVITPYYKWLVDKFNI